MVDSYTFHSTKPTAPGPYHLGVDEAGRGPVLGPMVYGVAFCPASYVEKLDDVGFDGAPALSLATERLCSLNSRAQTRRHSQQPQEQNYSKRLTQTPQTWAGPCAFSGVFTSSFPATGPYTASSPQALSRGMLRRPAINLNEQSKEATYLLIREVIAAGIELSHVFVDALGNTTTYQAQLSREFPGITFDVRPKADSIFKVVGAASVAAKVTRDAWIENWVFEEVAHAKPDVEDPDMEVSYTPTWATAVRGSGYPSGTYFGHLRGVEADRPFRPENQGVDCQLARAYVWIPIRNAVLVEYNQNAA